MAKFLTTNGLNYVIEEIIKTAKERVVLISPYLRLNDRIKELLSIGYRPDVDVQIIYGKKELEPRERQWLSTVPHIRTRFCQNLHAKCYLNESRCVITSLNLHLYSQQNNNEMGVMVKRGSDQQMFFDVAPRSTGFFESASRPTSIAKTSCSKLNPSEEFEKLHHATTPSYPPRI